MELMVYGVAALRGQASAPLCMSLTQASQERARWAVGSLAYTEWPWPSGLSTISLAFPDATGPPYFSSPAQGL